MGSQNLAGIQNYNLESLTVFFLEIIGEFPSVKFLKSPNHQSFIIPINQSISQWQKKFLQTTKIAKEI
jgi:hypothetical protein